VVQVQSGHFVWGLFSGDYKIQNAACHHSLLSLMLPHGVQEAFQASTWESRRAQLPA